LDPGVSRVTLCSVFVLGSRFATAVAPDPVPPASVIVTVGAVE